MRYVKVVGQVPEKTHSHVVSMRKRRPLLEFIVQLETGQLATENQFYRCMKASSSDSMSRNACSVQLVWCHGTPSSVFVKTTWGKGAECPPSLLFTRCLLLSVWMVVPDVCLCSFKCAGYYAAFCC